MEIDRAYAIADHISKMGANKNKNPKIPVSPTERKKYLAIQKQHQRESIKKKELISLI